ncbi:MAG: aspartyl/glutamyl-tRNA amidotransferase subunit C [Spirochaetaceae bacterium]|jgi:aspartyl-tRNA(Asn)/glutamyl-tRNA(Gln) amidotransferase subunit C|nr:aspartyl/glutamyl-tRNA amidotransferase subunit C [Spirochaetaceae bacterium]
MDSEGFSEADLIGDLRITASLARLDVDEAELQAAFPAFREVLSYFAAMQAADNDKKAFPDGLSGLSLAGADAVSSRWFRADTAAGPELALTDLGETMLDNSGERDSRFIVVPNVL